MVMSWAVLITPMAGLMSSAPLQHKTKLDFGKCLQYVSCKLELSICNRIIQKRENINTNIRFQMVMSWAMLNTPRARLMSSAPLQHKTKLDFAKCLQYTSCKPKIRIFDIIIQKRENIITNIRFQMVMSWAMLNTARAGLMSTTPLQHKTKLNFGKCLQYTSCKVKVSNYDRILQILDFIRTCHGLY